MSKALLVIDQLPFGALPTDLVGRASPVTLRYVPRTTPVGHATISTGQEPCDHRVQGRRWYHDTTGAWQRVDLDDLPRNAVGFPAAIRANLAANGLVPRLRASASGDEPIVVAAAKAFIPFLFGAWSADVAIYPLDTKPDRSSGELCIVAEGFTPAGVNAIRATREELRALAESHTQAWSPTSTIAAAMGRSPHGRPWLELRWTLPTSERRGLGWSRLVRAHASAIDAFYSAAALLALEELGGGPVGGTLIQSWFSTDLLGHLDGVGSPAYVAALSAGTAHAAHLAQLGYRVMVTSDHGGRRTPHHLVCDLQRFPPFQDQHGIMMTGLPAHGPPDPEPFISGDHVVAYGAHDRLAPALHYWTGAFIDSVPMPADEATFSFHPQQVPAWMLLPREDEMFAAAPPRAGINGGGNHGACVSPGPPAALSAIDATVPVLTLGPPPTTGWIAPRTLRDVAQAFVAL